MNTSIINVADLLKTGLRFVSPGFSADYNYGKENAKEYFEELMSNSPDSPIFSGILIFEKTGEIYSIVDGLQRLTTINLLLLALCKSCVGSTAVNKEAGDKIFSRYLISNNSPKLQLKGKDAEIFDKIVNDIYLSEDEKSSNIFSAYNEFLNKITNDKVNPSALFKFVSQMQFMVVLTKKSEISVRELYQALNGIKEDSQLNLIFDFIKQQDAIAGDKWEDIVEKYSELNVFENFLNDFLTTRIDEGLLNKTALYNNFKKYFYKVAKYQTMRDIVSSIDKYSNYYLKIISSDFESAEVKHQFEVLNNSEGKDTYPYLMEVMDDLESGHLDESALLNILMMINLFIKSRENVTVGNVSIDFSTLSKELNKMLVINDYVPEIMSENNKFSINEINALSKLGEKPIESESK